MLTKFQIIQKTMQVIHYVHLAVHIKRFIHKLKPEMSDIIFRKKIKILKTLSRIPFEFRMFLPQENYNETNELINANKSYNWIDNNQYKHRLNAINQPTAKAAKTSDEIKKQFTQTFIMEKNYIK